VRVAALAGAHILALENSLAAELPSRLHQQSTVAALRMAGGQLRELERVACLEVSPEQYVRNASRKSGAIFEFSAVAGALLGGSNKVDSGVLSKFGHDLGIAFQLFDDLHDFELLADSHRPASNDLRERIYTLPVLLACARGDSIGRELRRILRDDGFLLDARAIDQARALLASGGAFAESVALAGRWRESARAQVSKLSPSAARSALEEVLDSLQPPEGLGAVASPGETR